MTAVSYVAVLLLGLLLGLFFADEHPRTGRSALLPLNIINPPGKVQHLIDLIADRYVDSIGIDQLEDLAIDEIVAQLDPHSEYLGPNEALNQHETLGGSFDGIGIEYYNLNDTLMTVGIVPDGPAQHAGLRVGDKLLAIDGDTIAGKPVSDRMLEKKIRGRRGTAIEIAIHRNGVDLPLPLKVVRGRVEVSSIDAAYLIDSVTAYIKIKRFGAKTAEDFERALQHLKKQGAQQLVLDLRENGGGYFNAATALASHFFEDKQLIVYTEGAHEPRVDYFSSAGGLFGKGELAVLIDENSASASEIVAGAIQDLDRGVIVGRPSYGKALVQEQFGFSDGSALNLTVARYYTPLGRCIQKSYTIHTDSLAPVAELPVLGNPEPVAYTTRAGKEVYGGGGISPDVMVPADSSLATQLYREIRRANLIETYVYGKLTTSAPTYSVESYLKGYFLPDKEYKNFLLYARDNGLEYSTREANAAKPMVRSDIEALLGRYYFGSEAFFKVKNRSDKVLDSALVALNHKNTGSPANAQSAHQAAR